MKISEPGQGIPRTPPALNHFFRSPIDLYLAQPSSTLRARHNKHHSTLDFDTYLSVLAQVYVTLILVTLFTIIFIYK